jgi:hypothetical protein
LLFQRAGGGALLRGMEAILLREQRNFIGKGGTANGVINKLEKGGARLRRKRVEDAGGFCG